MGDSKIIEGCTAMVMNKSDSRNSGKIVRIGKFIGKAEGRKAHNDLWETDILMETNQHNFYRDYPEYGLRRIDHHKEDIKIKKQETTKEPA